VPHRSPSGGRASPPPGARPRPAMQVLPDSASSAKRYVLAPGRSNDEEDTMGVKFLTDEWATTMTDALNASDDFQKAISGQAAKLQQVVNGAPEGDGKYYFVLEGGKAQGSLGEL